MILNSPFVQHSIWEQSGKYKARIKFTSTSLSASPSNPLCELPQIEKHCFNLLPRNEAYGALHGGVMTFQMTQLICQLVSV